MPSDFAAEVPRGSPGRSLLYRGQRDTKELQKLIESLGTPELLQIRRQLGFLRRAAERRASRTWLPESVRDSEWGEAEELARRMRAISQELERRRA
jgi:hypothetical protein